MEGLEDVDLELDTEDPVDDKDPNEMSMLERLAFEKAEKKAAKVAAKEAAAEAAAEAAEAAAEAAEGGEEAGDDEKKEL